MEMKKYSWMCQHDNWIKRHNIDYKQNLEPVL